MEKQVSKCPPSRREFDNFSPQSQELEYCTGQCATGYSAALKNLPRKRLEISAPEQRPEPGLEADSCTPKPDSLIPFELRGTMSISWIRSMSMATTMAVVCRSVSYGGVLYASTPRTREGWEWWKLAVCSETLTATERKHNGLAVGSVDLRMSWSGGP